MVPREPLEDADDRKRDKKVRLATVALRREREKKDERSARVAERRDSDQFVSKFTAFQRRRAVYFIWLWNMSHKYFYELRAQKKGLKQGMKI